MRLRKLALAVGLASALGTEVASALGLGEIKLNSTLNQPLDAEIRLLQVREALLFGPEESLDPGHEMSPDLSSTLEKLSLPTIPTTICQKAMIWTEKEALRKQVERYK